MVNGVEAQQSLVDKGAHLNRVKAVPSALAQEIEKYTRETLRGSRYGECGASIALFEAPSRRAEIEARASSALSPGDAEAGGDPTGVNDIVLCMARSSLPSRPLRDPTAGVDAFQSLLVIAD